MSEIFESLEAISNPPINTGSIAGTQVRRDKVIIKPVPGSRRFAPVDATLVHKRTVNGQEHVVRSELYKGQKIPGSEQGLRVRWDEGLRSYQLDLKYLEQFGGLASIVEKLELTVSRGPKAGTLITKCNLSVRLDDFITEVVNRRPYMKEGEIILYTDNLLHLIWIAAKRMDKDFWAPEQAQGRNVVAVGTKYQMITESAEIAFKAEESSKKEKAFSLLGEVRKKGDDYARKLALILGIDPGLIKDSRTLFPFLVGYLEDAKTPSALEPNLTQQDYFIKLVNTPGDELETLYMFTIGKNKGVIKLTNSPTGNYYSFNKIPIGKNVEEISEFFKNPENFRTLEELTNLIKVH